MNTPQNGDRNLDRNADTYGDHAAGDTPTYDTNRADRTEHLDRTDGTDRADRTDRAGFNDRADRNDRNDRVDYRDQRRGAQAYDVKTETDPDDHSAQEAFIGTSRRGVAKGNVSWGAIFAGVVTFLAIMILLGVGAGAMGLQESSGAAIGIFTLIGLVIAFLAAGYVAGALGVRGGLFHGFATWATSLIAIVILAGWLGTSLIGTAGNIAGTVAETGAQAANVTSEDAQAATEAVDPAQANQAANQAQDAANQAANEAHQTFNEVAPQAAQGTWWTFAGLLIGALLSSLAGVAGARSVINKDRREVVHTQH